jgi:hypothetical protein
MRIDQGKEALKMPIAAAGWHNGAGLNVSRSRQSNCHFNQ